MDGLVAILTEALCVMLELKFTSWPRRLRQKHLVGLGMAVDAFSREFLVRSDDREARLVVVEAQEFREFRRVVARLAVVRRETARELVFVDVRMAVDAKALAVVVELEFAGGPRRLGHELGLRRDVAICALCTDLRVFARQLEACFVVIERLQVSELSGVVARRASRRRKAA